MKVSVLVPEGSCDEYDKREAKRFNVTIVEAENQPGLKDPVDCLYLSPKGLTTDIVIGVDDRLRKRAQIFKELHNCYDSFERSLSRDSELRDALAETDDECQGRSSVQPLMEVADLPVAFGPKMADKLSASFSHKKKEVFEITPGILSEFADVTHTQVIRKSFVSWL